MDFTEVLELDEQMAQSNLSNTALNKYIEVSTHLINMEDIAAARKLLLSIGFTKNNINGQKLFSPLRFSDRFGKLRTR